MVVVAWPVGVIPQNEVPNSSPFPALYTLTIRLFPLGGNIEFPSVRNVAPPLQRNGNRVKSKDKLEGRVSSGSRGETKTGYLYGKTKNNVDCTQNTQVPNPETRSLPGVRPSSTVQSEFSQQILVVLNKVSFKLV